MGSLGGVGVLPEGDLGPSELSDEELGAGPTLRWLGPAAACLPDGALLAVSKPHFALQPPPTSQDSGDTEQEAGALSRWRSKQVRENVLGQKDKETVSERLESQALRTCCFQDLQRKGEVQPAASKAGAPGKVQYFCSFLCKGKKPVQRSRLFLLTPSGGLAGLSAGASVLHAPLAPGPAAETFTWK